MEIQELEKKIAKIFCSKFKVYPKSDSSLSVDGSSIRFTQLYKYIDDNFYMDNLTPEEFVQFNRLVSNRQMFWESLGRKIAKYLNKDLVNKYKSQVLDENKSFRYGEPTLLVDIYTNEKVLFDDATQRRTHLSVDAWLETITRKDRDAALASAVRCIHKYNPRTTQPHRLVEAEGQEIYEINTYSPPEWMLKEVKNPKLPDYWVRFMNHLFPSDEVREYVYNWLYQMMTSRNQTYLLLNSNMGTGKGTFCEVARALVGRGNAHNTSEGFFKSHFNQELKDRRLIVFDEVPINKETRTTLKGIINDYIGIERKGHDPENIVSHCSFIINSNHAYNAKLLHNDRRFSAADITDIPLNQVIKEEETTLFLSHLDEHISNIGWWILKNGNSDKYQEFSVWKGPKFEYLCGEAMPDWGRFLIDKIKREGKKSYDVSELKSQYEIETNNKLFGGRQKIEGLLREYLDDDSVPYGIVEKDEETGRYEILVDKKYVKTDFDEDDEEFDL